MPKKTEKKENVKLNPVIQSEIKEKIDNSKYGEFAFDFWLSQTLVHTLSIYRAFLQEEIDVDEYQMTLQKVHDNSRDILSEGKEKQFGLRADKSLLGMATITEDPKEKEEGYTAIKNANAAFEKKLSTLTGTAKEFIPLLKCSTLGARGMGDFCTIMQDHPFFQHFVNAVPIGGFPHIITKPVLDKKNQPLLDKKGRPLTEIDFDAMKENMGESFKPFVKLSEHCVNLYDLEVEKMRYEKEGWTRQGYIAHRAKLIETLKGIRSCVNELQELAKKNPEKYGTDVYNNKLGDMLLPGLDKRNQDNALAQIDGEIAALEQGWDVTELAFVGAVAETGKGLSAEYQAFMEGPYAQYGKLDKEIKQIEAEEDRLRTESDRIAGTQEFKDFLKANDELFKEGRKIKQEYNNIILAEDDINVGMEKGKQYMAEHEAVYNKFLEADKKREEFLLLDKLSALFSEKRKKESEQKKLEWVEERKKNFDSVIKGYVKFETRLRKSTVNCDQHKADLIEEFLSFKEEFGNKIIGHKKDGHKLNDIIDPSLPAINEIKNKADIRYMMSDDSDGFDNFSDELNEYEHMIPKKQKTPLLNGIIKDVEEFNDKKNSQTYDKYGETGTYDSTEFMDDANNLRMRLRGEMARLEQKMLPELKEINDKYPENLRNVSSKKRNAIIDRNPDLHPFSVNDIILYATWPDYRKEKVDAFMAGKGKKDVYATYDCLKKILAKLEKRIELDKRNIKISNIRKAEYPDWNHNYGMAPDPDAPNFNGPVFDDAEEEKNAENDNIKQNNKEEIIEENKTGDINTGEINTGEINTGEINTDEPVNNEPLVEIINTDIDTGEKKENFVSEKENGGLKFELNKESRKTVIDKMISDMLRVDPQYMISSPAFRTFRASLEEFQRFSESLPENSRKFSEEQADAFIKKAQAVKDSAMAYRAAKKKEAADYVKKKNKILKRKQSTINRMNFATDTIEGIDRLLENHLHGLARLEFNGDEEQRVNAKTDRLLREYGRDMEKYGSDANENRSKINTLFYRAAYVEILKRKYANDPTYTIEQFSEDISSNNIKKGAIKLYKKLSPYGFNEHIAKVISGKGDLDSDFEEVVDPDYYDEMIKLDPMLSSKEPKSVHTYLGEGRGFGESWVRFELKQAASMIALFEKKISKPRESLLAELGFEFKKGRLLSIGDEDVAEEDFVKENTVKNKPEEQKNEDKKQEEVGDFDEIGEEEMEYIRQTQIIGNKPQNPNEPENKPEIENEFEFDDFAPDYESNSYGESGKKKGKETDTGDTISETGLKLNEIETLNMENVVYDPTPEQKNLLDNAYRCMYSALVRSYNRKESEYNKAMKAYDKSEDSQAKKDFRNAVSKNPVYKEFFEKGVLKYKPSTVKEVTEMSDRIISGLNREAKKYANNKEFASMAKDAVKKFGIDRNGIQKAAEEKPVIKKNSGMMP